MTVRIEIVGDSPTAQRMLQQMSSLKGFEITRVPSQQRQVSVIVLDDPASDSIEALPVVTLGIRRES